MSRPFPPIRVISFFTGREPPAKHSPGGKFLDSFIARQPIFDARQKVYGYELLFRSGLDNVFRGADPDQATSKVLTDSLSLFSMSTLTGGKRGFINITRDILLRDYVYLIPKEQIVVEVLETVRPDGEVVEACRRLKEAGYLLAMDDFVYSEDYRPLVDLADFIKVDFLQTPDAERRDVMEKCRTGKIRFLAEKVENLKTFDEARGIGYAYFQGYFFSKPTVLSRKDIPRFKLNYLRILQEVNRPEMDFGRLGDFIRREISLSYKLLRYINSAFFSLRGKISSIKQALVLLGEREIKNWISLVALAGMGDDKPEELAVQAIIRARFCQSLAPYAGLAHKAEDLFLLGLLSLIDAFLDRPMAELLQEIPVADEIKKALLGAESSLGKVYRFVLAYERGEWDQTAEHRQALGIAEAHPPRLYLAAVEWGQKCFQENLKPAN
jgi:c-di-GMP-related signal transduction protein